MSNGGTGFSADGCVGCHGRAEDNNGIGTSGAGLRQHHYRAGKTVCANCHDDANPAKYQPVGENIAPPYYFTPDDAHLNKPTDSCNPSGEEDFAGTAIGLDNDGDGLYDGNDPDCAAAPACIDKDGDGYGANGASTCPNGTAIDCNDGDAAVNPGAKEICDGVDNNCNGQTDEGTTSTYFKDADGDGYGDPKAPSQGCTQPAGYVANNTDCNDSNPNEHPNQTWYQDADGDGYSSGNMVVQCSRPSGYKLTSELTATSGDCNDSSASTHPGVSDNTCNGIDENCSGTADEGYTPTNTTCGVGLCGSTGQLVCQNGTTVDTCSPGAPATEGPAGDATCGDSLDNNCDGLTDTSDPNCVQACVPTTEICDGVDNDCDGQIDEGIPSTPTTCGVGECASSGTQSCVNGQLVDSCSPGTPTAEICDGKDNNCNGTVDDGIASTPTTCGVGLCGSTGQLVCQNGTTVDTCSPGAPATEGPVGDATCGDSQDNDCDGLTDTADSDCGATDPACIDNDEDGYGTNGASTCPNGTAIDCNDNDPMEHPVQMWYPDADGDGYSSGDILIQCSRPDGYKTADELTATSGDCNDSDPTIHLDAAEICGDHIDQNCNGNKDDKCAGGSREGKGRTCSDGIDNDLDGYTDCDDLGCSENRSCIYNPRNSEGEIDGHHEYSYSSDEHES